MIKPAYVLLYLHVAQIPGKDYKTDTWITLLMKVCEIYRPGIYDGVDKLKDVGIFKQLHFVDNSSSVYKIILIWFVFLLSSLQTTNIAFALQSSVTRRRFSEFCWLRKQLKDHHPQL